MQLVARLMNRYGVSYAALEPGLGMVCLWCSACSELAWRTSKLLVRSTAARSARLQRKCRRVNPKSCSFTAAILSQLRAVLVYSASAGLRDLVF